MTQGGVEGCSFFGMSCIEMKHSSSTCAFFICGFVLSILLAFKK